MFRLHDNIHRIHGSSVAGIIDHQQRRPDTTAMWLPPTTILIIIIKVFIIIIINGIVFAMFLDGVINLVGDGRFGGSSSSANQQQ